MWSALSSLSSSEDGSCEGEGAGASGGGGVTAASAALRAASALRGATGGEATADASGLRRDASVRLRLLELGFGAIYRRLRAGG